MTDNEELFHQLIAASSKLATVSELAADVLSEQFDTLVRPSVNDVRSILALCPQPANDDWDGELRDQDVLETTYEAPSPQGERRVGVSLRHKITGIVRQSYTKPTTDENRAVARDSLEQAVQDRYRSLQKGR